MKSHDTTQTARKLQLSRKHYPADHNRSMGNSRSKRRLAIQWQSSCNPITISISSPTNIYIYLIELRLAWGGNQGGGEGNGDLPLLLPSPSPKPNQSHPLVIIDYHNHFKRIILSSYAFVILFSSCVFFIRLCDAFLFS